MRRTLLRAGEEAVGLGVAGTDDQPITFAPPIVPVARFGPDPVPTLVPTLEGASVTVDVGAELEAVRLERRELATDAGIVEVTVNVLPVSVGDAGAAVVVLGLLSAGGGVPTSPPFPNATFPPIGAVVISSARRSLLVSTKTPRGPAIISAWNCWTRSFSNGWAVFVT